MSRRTSAKLVGWCGGGASRDRTDDLLVANQALSQLSYGPLEPEDREMVGPVGLEPTT